MAWPPPVLPTDRTNSTPQLDTHPADHNAANQAINDIAGQLYVVTEFTSGAGCAATAASMTLQQGQVTPMIWTGWSDPAWNGGPGFLQVPTAAPPNTVTGMYVICAELKGPTHVAGTNLILAQLVTNTFTHDAYFAPTTSSVIVTWIERLAPGDQISLNAYNSQVGAQFFSADLTIIRASA